MKRIEAIIKPHKLEEVIRALNEAGVMGLTVMEVKGFGRQRGHTEIFRESEYSVDCMPKAKIEVVVCDEQASAVINAVLKSARTGKIGDGKIFVAAVEQAVRIRTGQQGAEAVN